MRTFLPILLLVVGEICVFGLKESVNDHEQHTRLLVPPSDCDTYYNKKDCKIDCRCRWCYNTTKCYDPLYNDVTCEHHSGKTSQCKVTENTLSIIALVFISIFGLIVGMPVGCIVIVIFCALIVFVIYGIVLVLYFVLKTLRSFCSCCCWPFKLCFEDTYDRIRGVGAGKPLLKIFNNI